MPQAKSPIPNAHARLSQAHRLWHQAADAYNDAEGFRTNLNSLIETLRNVTFVLQNEKAKIPQFDEWYSSWQARLKADKIMSWLHEARTTIVHKSDLEVLSKASAKIHNNLNLLVISKEVPPTMTTSQICQAIINALPEPFASNKKDLILSVERSWHVPDLPDVELLDALAHAYGTLSLLLRDAHHKCGYRFETTGHDGDSVELISGRIPCMITTLEMRTARISLETGDRLGVDKKKVPLNPEFETKAARRYNFQESPTFPADPFTMAETLIPMAKKVLIKDKEHLRMVFLRKGSEWEMRVLMCPDRAAKYVMMRRLAEEIRSLGVDALVEISEAWLGSLKDAKAGRAPEDAHNRKEVLLVSAATSTGKYRCYHSFFSRNLFGSIKFGDTVMEEGTWPPYLAPVCEVWGLPAPKPAESFES